MLNVQPNAEPEVIEAAYRRLMRKYHPDMAGADPGRRAEYEARARLLNAAYSVLRNPERRARNDDERRRYGTQPRSTPGPRTPPPSAPPASHGEAGQAVIIRLSESDLPAPLGLISAAYYLLPGPYESKGLLTVSLLPLVGLVAFLLLVMAIYHHFNP